MKNTNFKTKFIARIMLLVLLLASVFSFAGCSKKESIDINKRFNIDDGKINFLCMRSVSNVFSEYTYREHSWSDGNYLNGLYIQDGIEYYSRPSISYSVTINSAELGDGRTFYEKYINKYVDMQGSYEYSMKIHGEFYAFQGDADSFRYEFDKHNFKGENIKIYSEEELIAELSVVTKLKKSEDFYRELLDKTLFVITVDKYSEIEYSAIKPNDIYESNHNLNYTNLSYLGIRDIRNSKDVDELITYKSSFNGGYSGVYWDTLYHDVVNEIEIQFSSGMLDTNIQMEAEFYEYRADMGEIFYSFVTDTENGGCIELYSNSWLVGKIFYTSTAEISKEWLTDFLNENLVVISVAE